MEVRYLGWALGLIAIAPSARAEQVVTATMTATAAAEAPEQMGAIDPGKGFEIFKATYGSLSISLYTAFRYLNQTPADQTYRDHLGVERVVKTRNDFNQHRTMIHFRGFLFDPDFRYVATLWTVLSTNQVAVI